MSGFSTAPTSPDAIWALSSLFRTDWAGKVENRSAFETDISGALTSAEQRIGLAGRPVRTTTLEAQAHTPEQVQDLQTLVMRGTVARGLFPLASDLTLLTEPAVATDTAIACDTTTRRFFAGHYAVIIRDTTEPTTSRLEVVKVTAVASGSLTIEDPLVNDYAAGDVVFPLIISQPIPSNSGKLLTDSVMTASIEATEAVGLQLPCIVEIGDTPPGFSTHDGFPILPADMVEWEDGIDVGTERDGAFELSGIEQVPGFLGSRGKGTLDLPIRCLDRNTAWDAIGLFESRGGRLLPFWLVSPSTTYEAEAVVGGGTGISVTAFGEIEDWDMRPYIAIELADGSTVVRGVDGVSRGAGLDTVTFDTAVGSLLIGNIVRCTVAFFVKLSSDEMVEKWYTSETMDTTFSVIEVLEEKDITIADLTILDSTDLISPFVPGDCTLGISVTCNLAEFVSWDTIGGVEPSDFATNYQYRWYGTTADQASSPPMDVALYFQALGGFIENTNWVYSGGIASRDIQITSGVPAVLFTNEGYQNGIANNSDYGVRDQSIADPHDIHSVIGLGPLFNPGHALIWKTCPNFGTKYAVKLPFVVKDIDIFWTFNLDASSPGSADTVTFMARTNFSNNDADRGIQSYVREFRVYHGTSLVNTYPVDANAFQKYDWRPGSGFYSNKLHRAEVLRNGTTWTFKVDGVTLGVETIAPSSDKHGMAFGSVGFAGNGVTYMGACKRKLS